MKRYALPLSLFLGAVPLAGCGDPALSQSPIAGGPSFAAVPRPPEYGAKAGSLRQALGGPDVVDRGPGDSFFLAINKKELGQRYFLSAFIRQYHPGGSAQAARSVGTQVVTLRTSNNRLYVVRADSISDTSDTFKPDGVILDAYPLISDYTPFSSLPGAEDYVLLDPAAGLSRFTAVYTEYEGGHFQEEAAWVQRYRATDDGITFERVLIGSAPYPIQAAGAPNIYRAQAVIGTALRRYTEGKGFKEVVPEPSDPAHYFVHGPRLLKNQGGTDYVAAHWNTGDPARKIEWVISPLLPAKYQGAVKDAILSWNEVFGRELLTARVGAPDESYADDDKNYVIFDGDPTLGVAFANWRINPNTGEIRGASVYINVGWFDFADTLKDDTMAAPRRADDGGAARQVPPRLSWDGVTQGPLCELHLGDDVGLPRPAPGPGPSDNLTGMEKGVRYIRHVIAHEIGHDLGLRHNFKGSLLTGMGSDGSTVMDYQGVDERINLYRPGAYDKAAVALLYGMSPDRPPQPFCTDNGVRVDPECQQFDSRSDPLNQYWRPSYEGFANEYLSAKSDVSPNNSLNNMLMFVRAGKDAAQRLAAWQLVIAPVALAAPAPMPRPADYAARKDLLARRVLQRAWLDAATLRGNITQDPPRDAGLVTAWLPELRGSLLNSDGVRSYATRRVTVDVLKRLQIVQAAAVLREARATLAGELGGLSGEALLSHRDLISRIDAALAPYFP